MVIMRYYVLSSEDMEKLNNNELITFTDPSGKPSAICTSDAYTKFTTIQQESQEEKP